MAFSATRGKMKYGVDFMTYCSTRGGVKGVPFSEAVLKGIAPDGGLFVPEKDVHFDSLDMSDMCNMSYCQLASFIFRQFAGDFTDEEIDECVNNAYGDYSSFPPVVAPVSNVSDTLSVLELWHGPTSAFKDIALQILPEFMSVALRKRSRKEESKTHPSKIAILTATSGDTGKAALEGFKDAENIKIMVFYPENGVSEMQKYQMITQEGGNVSVVAVRGNFDDAQTGVKKIFGDKEFCGKMKEKGYELSSANSINIGRLLPQVVYYFYAYFTMVRSGRIGLGDKLNFVVPTGNFGNILACYYAQKCGLNVGKIICATNSNSVVSDFLSTGTYDANRQFILTISPAMDILVSSNLERLLYDASGKDAKCTADLMNRLKENGVYSVPGRISSFIKEFFVSSSSTEEETVSTIRNMWKEYGYLTDPHTAVGINVYDKYVISSGDMTKTVAVSTASPFKFNRSVMEAITSPSECRDLSEFEILGRLSEKTELPVPEPLKGLDKKDILHKKVCEKSSMVNEVEDFLND